MSTKAALLTPAGRGAIATVRVEGDHAVEIVESLFRSATNRKISEQPLGRILFGQWQSTAEHHEELVVCHTEKHSVEVQCHGGVAAVDAILSSLEKSGCDVVDWPEMLITADLIEREARIDLASATTERTAAILLDQLNGALSNELKTIIDLLRCNISESLARIERLLSNSDVGLHLVNPWRVVIAGAPNVGKSSLINAILGFERAIVFDQPGTTRDVVTGHTALDGWPIELSDTAGIRTSNDRLEMAGVEFARKQMEKADLIVHVIAANEATSASDLQIDEAKPTITVFNKCDLSTSGSFPDGSIQTVATTGDGVNALIQRVVETLVPCSPKDGEPIPFTKRQVSHLQSAVHRLRLNKTDDAETSLLAILENAPE
ncbi:MAG: 50S ribosome-binding GTPase [Planctomycetales bacterium]|nr:50S ribosome-binding GTPase [Planctomycetales bacterium]